MKEETYHGGTEARRRDCVNLAQASGICGAERSVGTLGNLHQVHAMFVEERKRRRCTMPLAGLPAEGPFPCPPKDKPFEKSASRGCQPRGQRPKQEPRDADFSKLFSLSSPCLCASVVKSSLGVWKAAIGEGEHLYGCNEVTTRLLR